MKYSIFSTLISLLILLFSCSESSLEYNKAEKSPKQIKPETPSYNYPIKHTDTTISLFFNDSSEIISEIKFPDSTKYKATLLILHGWNLPGNEWCEETDFCNLALKRGYALIIPDFKKTNYFLNIYPETVHKYQEFPTLTWIMHTYIPHINSEFGLLHEEQNNFIAGLSTGGRGAIMLAYHLPKIFKGVASLSGDFDIIKMQNLYIYYAFLGKYADFPQRWEEEHFAKDCKNYNVPTYIGHGQQDKITPIIQSKMMYDSIKTNRPDLIIEKNFPTESGHDYIYWGSESNNILNFFDKLIKP